MRIKEIGTVLAAGLVSLAAVVILEKQDSAPIPSPEYPSTPAFVDFDDTSSLLESSVPAPTAEPPTIEETQGHDLFEIEGVVTAAPSAADIVTTEEDPISDPLPELSELADVVVDESNAQLTDLAQFETDQTSLGSNSDLAGIDQDENLSDQGPASFSDTFADAIAEATGTPPAPGPAPVTTATQAVSSDSPASVIEETPTGFWLREAKLNDVFQHLSQLGNYQYFHNAELSGPSYVVTGQLMDDDPLKQMEELALMYAVTIHTKGNTVYAFTSAQLTTLPTMPFRYQLKYLRPSDIEQIKLILQPFLTPGSGIIEYETKTNTLIVMDNERKLDALALFLTQIDQPKEQIAIETRILRVTSTSGNRIGVDWSAVLGEKGLALGGSASLNSLFNLPELAIAQKVLTTMTSGALGLVDPETSNFNLDTRSESAYNNSNLVLAPAELSAVLRALNAGGLAQQESSPTLITEDNEEGLISIIDRIPIITATVSETASGSNISEEVRYQIDEQDPVGDPATTREVGVSVVVIPTILPDGTIRMTLRPRAAQVVEYVQGRNGNSYPRVNESTVTTTARVPNGHSLLIGGFYEETSRDQTNKVPLLGDIPAVSFLFKSTEKIKEHTSLVFIVTPKLYRPESKMENDLMSHEIHESHILPTDHDYPDRMNPGHSYNSDMRNTVGNIFNKYEPDPPSNLLHPGHPYNRPEALPVHGKNNNRTEQLEPQFVHPSVTVRSVEDRPKNNGFFGGLFGKNKSNNQ